MMMRKGMFAFAAGMAAGVAAGAMMDPEKRKKVQNKVREQAGKMRKYEAPVKESMEKVKKFMKVKPVKA